MTAVLIVRPSSLGDIVHALPVVADIRAHVPGAAIDWVAEEAFAPLVRLHADVRHVIPVALRRWRHHLLDADVWNEFTAFRSAVRASRYDAVLDLQEQMKGALIARLARGVRHGFARGSVREPASTLLHARHHAVSPDLHFETRCRVMAGQAFGYVPEGRPHYGLVVPPAPAGLLPARPYVVAVHVTSRDDKRWPEERWHALLDALATAGYDVLLPWGNEAERERSEALARGHDHASVPEHQPLARLTPLLRSATLVVGVDTGLVHLAAALGTPTVALFTSTDAALAGVATAGPHARDLGGNGDVPSVDAVLQAAGTLLAAAPRC